MSRAAPSRWTGPTSDMDGEDRKYDHLSTYAHCCGRFLLSALGISNAHKRRSVMVRRFALFLSLAVFLFAVQPAFGQSVTFSGQRMSKTNPGSSGCTDPPATTAFLTTDNIAYLYFYATTTLSDHITSDW